VHNALDPRDLVPDEAEQLLSAGYPAAELLEKARRAAADDDLTALAAIENELASLERAADWAYDEPAATTGTVATTAVDEASLPERIRCAWLGRCVGNTMGKPVEGLSRADVEVYLRAADAWPLTGFVPYLEEPPVRTHPSAREASDGRFDAVPRDDDIDWTMLGLHVLETYGRGVTTDDIAREWLDRMPFTQTYTAERVAYRNLVAGLRPPLTATVRNPYREWIGALIRVDAYGYVNPGDPAEAARLALVDASLSHTANGVYGRAVGCGSAGAGVGLLVGRGRLAGRAGGGPAEVPARSQPTDLAGSVRRRRVCRGRAGLDRHGAGLQLGPHAEQRRNHQHGSAVG